MPSLHLHRLVHRHDQDTGVTYHRNVSIVVRSLPTIPTRASCLTSYLLLMRVVVPAPPERQPQSTSSLRHSASPLFAAS